MKKARLLFYVQHLLGIGHLARASRIAVAAVEDGIDVTMVTGGLPVRGFPDPLVKTVALPAVAAASEGFTGLVDADGHPVDEAFRERRRDMLLATLRDLAPEIVAIEAFPFGRRQMRFELLPLLDAISAMIPRPKLATSVRDILQERNKPGRDEETVAILNRHFDLVMVHGDPGFARIEDTFPLAAEITARIGYTGLVADKPAAPATDRFDILVSAGGGAAGAVLVHAAVEAARGLSPALRWGLIAGPNLPQAAFDAAVAAAPEGMAVFRFRPDFPSLLTGARLSVSQAGYNTVCDVLRAGCRSVLAPFSAGGETEQSFRAERLARLGLATVVDEDSLTGEALASTIGVALAAAKPRPASLDLDGARKSARMLRSLLYS